MKTSNASLNAIRKASASNVLTFRKFDVLPSSYVSTIYCLPSYKVSKWAGLAYSVPFLAESCLELISSIRRVNKEVGPLGCLAELGSRYSWYFDSSDDCILAHIACSLQYKYMSISDLLNSLDTAATLLFSLSDVAELTF